MLSGVVGSVTRAAVYLRVSRPEQAKGYSLDGQYREVRAYCERRGFKVTRRLSDVESGRNPERPGLLQLVDLVERGHVDVVVVWRRDRFGRDLVTNTLLERQFREKGVQIEACSMGPQQDTPHARLMSRIQDAMDEFEAENIAARCQLGKREAAQRGVWPNKPPFGYRRARESKQLEPRPSEAFLVRYAFNLATEGCTVRQIAGIMGWSHTKAVSTLHREAYLGVLCYDDVRTPGAWPPLVDRETWKEAQRSLKEKRPASLLTS